MEYNKNKELCSLTDDEAEGFQSFVLLDIFYTIDYLAEANDEERQGKEEDYDMDYIREVVHDIDRLISIYEMFKGGKTSLTKDELIFFEDRLSLDLLEIIKDKRNIIENENWLIMLCDLLKICKEVRKKLKKF